MSMNVKIASLAGLAALSALVIPSCIPDQDSVGPSTTKPTNSLKGAESVRITDEIVTSDGTAVKPGSSQTYGHGYIVGSPISSGFEGPLFKTYELHINQGAFADNPAYIGSSVQLSVDSQNSEIYQSFKAVEEHSRQQYVFEYASKFPLNAEVESTHNFLKNVYTKPEFLQQLNVESLPKGIKAKEPWAGSHGNKTKVGRIVDVERFGELGDFCAVEVNMTGLADAGGERLVTLAVVDEGIAAWCEKAMALGRDVDIDISEDVIELWQPSSMFINGIKFREEVSTPLEVKQESKQSQLTEQQYIELRNRLMKDPIFNARKTR